MKHRCVNCAYYEGDKRDWCNEGSPLDDTLCDKNPAEYHCTGWTSEKHRLRIAAMKAVDCLNWRIEQGFTPIPKLEVLDLIDLLERGLEK